MLTGMTYDLRSEYLREGFTDEETAEFDRDSTIDAIEEALNRLGYETDRIGHVRNLAERLVRGDRWDIVFNISEGMYGIGREAQVPCLLDAYGIPYTFSDPLVLTLTLHKGMTKRVIRDAGLNTPDFLVVTHPGDTDSCRLGYPLFVKPVAEGTGKGISSKSRISGQEELRQFCSELLKVYPDGLIVEEFLPGREFTVGIVGSGKKSRVKTIESFNTPPCREASSGCAAGFTLDEQIYITRGEIAARDDEQKPSVSSLLKVNLFWLGKDPMVMKKEYLFKLGASKIPARLESITRIIDASDLNATQDKHQIERHDVAECVLKLNRAVAFDPAADIANLGRFVIVDNYEIRGGGIIAEALEDRQSWLRNTVLLRNYKWEKSIIAPEKRAEKYNQKSTLLLLTGEKGIDKKRIAKVLEDRLFEDGKVVYFLGIGNVLYGIDADIKGKTDQRKEHMRRLAEVANILLDAGIILLVTAIEVTQDDLEIIKTIVSSEKIETVWLGENVTTDISYDLRLHQPQHVEESVDQLKAYLQDKGIIFRPW